AHERESREEIDLAEAHVDQYEPNTAAGRAYCPVTGSRIRAGVRRSCWTSSVNPTAEHLREAEEHRRHAADHRAASASLREAEAQACVGITSDDRDMSPFNHVEDIVEVEPLPEATTSNEAASEQTAGAVTAQTTGAVITFRPIPGMTAEWLQAVVDCHIARNSSLGHIVPEEPNCPLVPHGVRAQVSATGDGLAVAIRSDDPETGREIFSRSERLASAP
ncbi:MAG: hypothetical protein ACI9KE_002215, partial [Polyangiales bacterium]